MLYAKAGMRWQLFGIETAFGQIGEIRPLVDIGKPLLPGPQPQGGQLRAAKGVPAGLCQKSPEPPLILGLERPCH